VRKKIIILPVLTVFILSISFVLLTGESENLFATLFGEEFMSNQDASLEIAEDIINSFPENRDGTRRYDDDFGGMYIDSDGNLVLLIVGDENTRVDESRIARFGTDNIRFVEFPYSELQKVWQEIFDFLLAYWDDPSCYVAQNICSAGIGTNDNRVNVYLLDTSDEQIELFRVVVIDHPALVFIHSIGGHIDDILLYCEYESHYTPVEYPDAYTSVAPLTIVPLRQGAAVRVSGVIQSVGYFVSHMSAHNNIGFVTTMHNSGTGLAVGHHFYLADVAIPCNA